MKIELNNVSKAYGQGDAKFWALREATFTASDGDFVSIVGPSGSGKSTMLHLLGCLDWPTEGTVRVDDAETKSLSDKQLSRIRRDHIGFVFQQYFLGREKAEAALDIVGLSHRLRSFPSELSGGEQQRCAIARALANSPSLLLADEPTGSLDTKSGKNILEMLISLNSERNLGLVIVTHDEAVASTASTTLKVLDGRIS